LRVVVFSLFIRVKAVC